ncbi:MAG: chemotaxis protein CheW [Acidobacteria bacterium]|nr:chemotaxis protein CheW [Acidobacteriota bacterium]
MPGIVSQTRLSKDLLIAAFDLGSTGAFGIDATLIQEVVMVGEITRVHRAAPYVEGIRNLRGRMVTVIDLAMRLGLGRAQRSAESRILIVDWNGEPIGLLVDSVADAISVESCALEPVPPNLPPSSLAAIRGVFRKGDHLIALLDLHPLLSVEARGGRTSNAEESRVGRS